MRALDREDVAVVGDAAVPIGGLDLRRYCENRNRGEEKKGAAPQWCSITRSTMLYSFASSALMK